MTSDDGYLLGNERPGAGERLEALAAIFDRSTQRHLEDVGVTEGWRCWEVGAGGPSIVRWLADRVGDSGRVLATDIDLTHLAVAESPTVQVLEHDVVWEPPAEDHFDLVHARLVLVHVPDRDIALRSMVRALRPGGVLVVEDADPALQPLSCIDPRTPAEELANRLRVGFRSLLAERGVDLEYGRKLPRLCREAGLADVVGDGWFPVVLPECERLELATIESVRLQLVEREIASDAEIDKHLANVRLGLVDLAQPPMITVWGRRPVSAR